MQDFRKGDTKTIKISYGTDITGYRFRLTFLKAFDQVTPDLVVESLVGDHPGDIPLEGLAYLRMESTESATLNPDKYFYFVQRIIDGTVPEDITTIMPPIKYYKDKIIVVE